MEALRPGVEKGKSEAGDAVENSVKFCAKLSAQNINTAGALLSELAEKGTIKVVAARYDLDSGLVEILP